MRLPYDANGGEVYPEDVLDAEELATYYTQTGHPWGGPR